MQKINIMCPNHHKPTESVFFDGVKYHCKCKRAIPNDVKRLIFSVLGTSLIMVNTIFFVKLINKWYAIPIFVAGQVIAFLIYDLHYKYRFKKNEPVLPNITIIPGGIARRD